MLTPEQVEKAREHIAGLESFIDGKEDDLGTLLGEVVEFLQGLPGVSNGEIGHGGEYRFTVHVSAQPGKRIVGPREVLSAGIAKTLADSLWMNLPGTRSTPPEGRIEVYTINVD